MDPDAALDELLALLDRTTTLADMHLPPRVLTHDIRRIIELEQQLDLVARQRDELAARLSEVSSERTRLAQQLAVLLRRGSQERPAAAE